ncbi:MAG: class I SAM-dependent methyltransferase [Chloroflexota bacterium]
MKAETVSALLQINAQFYQTFAAAFAATRRRIQPGVRRVIESLPVGGRLLDLGCGSGALALELDRRWQTGCYLGLDSSAALLAEARAALRAAPPGGVDIRFARADLANPDWVEQTAAVPVDVALAFAVLHHLPSHDLRLRVMSQVNGLLPPGGAFIHSEWQFQHSARWQARIQPWQAAGIDAAELEEGDTLLDWRHALPGQVEQVGLRYVHLFSRSELSHLAQQSGFVIGSEFESDGEGGRLSLYQTWHKPV